MKKDARAFKFRFLFFGKACVAWVEGVRWLGKKSWVAVRRASWAEISDFRRRRENRTENLAEIWRKICSSNSA